MTSFLMRLCMSIPWQCFALTGVVFSGLEDIGDRYAINVRPSLVAASFTRIAIYLIFATAIVPLSGRQFFWYPHWPVILLAGIGVVSSLAWSKILARISASTVSIFAFVSPILFLLIDRITGWHISLLEALAVVGMVLGGIGFAWSEAIRLDRFTIFGVAWIIFNTGAEAYYVKYAQVTYHLDPMVMLLNIWVWATLIMATIIGYQRGWKDYFQPQVFRYARRCLFGKSADVLSSLCWSIGLTLTTVSQLSAINAFYPLIIMVLVWIIQGGLRVDLGEDLRPAAITRKSLSAILLFLSLSVI